jgi:CheY-like chemotaxis protein
MKKYGPIIVVEDDEDDCQFMEEVFVDMGTKYERTYFSSGQEALNFLSTTSVQPFLIISDVNLPGVDGPKFKLTLNENEYLRKKSIPFVFLTTTANREAVDKAYEMMVQGYFEKPTRHAEIKTLLKLILDYWEVCLHPNTF